MCTIYEGYNTTLDVLIKRLEDGENVSIEEILGELYIVRMDIWENKMGDDL